MPDDAPRLRLATIEVRRRIVLADDTTSTIRPVNSRWSIHRALWPGMVPAPGDMPVAIFQHERVDLLR